MDTLPFSQACENNKDFILENLSRVFAVSERVLEIGSGTGQHAVHFAGHLPHLLWQPTELAQHLPVTLPRVEAYPGSNLLPVQVLDVCERPWTLPERSPEDLQIMQNQQTDSIRCFQGFAWDEVTPCYFDNSTLPRAKWRGHVPIYEQRRDHSGQPFDSLLNLFIGL